MNKTDNILLVMYVSIILIALLICLTFEVIIPDFFGILFDGSDRTLRFIVETICHIVSLFGIFSTFKLMSISKVRNKLKDERSYLKYATIRYALLCIPLFLCELTYYLFCSTNVVAYCGICAIALLFVWPTQERRLHEMTAENESK